MVGVWQRCHRYGHAAATGDFTVTLLRYVTTPVAQAIEKFTRTATQDSVGVCYWISDDPIGPFGYRTEKGSVLTES